MIRHFDFNKDAKLLIDRTKNEEYLKIEVTGSTQEERISSLVAMQRDAKLSSSNRQTDDNCYATSNGEK